MKVLWFMVLAFAGVFALATAGRAADDKEVTLKGDIMCAKCELKEGSKCANVIKVKDGDKEVVYYFLDKGNKEDYHEPLCGGGKKAGSVTGVVSEKDGKKWIKPSKVDYAKN